jgi:GTP-binding nuclear protein Ran
MSASASPAASFPNIRIALVGANQVGKHTFAKRFLDGAKNSSRERTAAGREAVECFPILFHTNLGPIRADVLVADSSSYIDSAVPSPFAEMKIDAAIIMFSVHDQSSYDKVPAIFNSLYIEQSRSLLSQQKPSEAALPVCLIGNKIDLTNRVVTPKSITFHRENNLNYFDVAAKSNFNIEKPFLSLLRKHFQNEHLTLVDAPALKRPEFM